MSDPDVIVAAAERLWAAAATGVPCAPVRDLIDPTDGDTAYAVQQINVERLLAERGWRVSGRKIGLTSPAVQAQLGVDRPDFGTLFAELGHGDSDVVPIATLLQPRIEAEVALVLGADLHDTEATADDIAAATASAHAALEIVDSRVAGWDIRFADTVADNASAGRYAVAADGIALGGPDGIDLAAVEMVMTVNGKPRSHGSGAACLGSPLLAAAWLARTLAEQGTPLRAGDVVLTGALGPMVDVHPGDLVETVISGVGRLSVRFDGVDPVGGHQ